MLAFTISFLFFAASFQWFFWWRIRKVQELYNSDDGRWITMAVQQQMMRQFWRPLKSFVKETAE